MCFENLPIVFDEQGRPHLDGSFDVVRSASPALDQRGVAFDIDPVTRVAGSMSVHARVDPTEGRVFEAHVDAGMFRGYELILRGREPADAIDISSRACGVCGGVHAVCASMCLEMIFGATPTPLAIHARNLGEAAELLYDHTLHLFLLAGPDYSEAMVSRTTPSLWDRAQRAAAPRASIHGFVTMGDIMKALNPLEGALYRQALEVTRTGREIVTLVFGKYPHPSTVVPAGLSGSLDRGTLNQILARTVRLLDFAKLTTAIWEDLTAFFYDADPAYREVGVRRCNLITTGMWDDPDVYDASYETADDWGRARQTTPGVVIDGTLRTTALRQIAAGVEEFVDHSFYADWADHTATQTAPDGTPLSPYHPWNKQTIPKPESRSWRDRYSWATAPRWDREPMESGPFARQWVTAGAGLVSTRFIGSGRGEIEVDIPAGQLPALTSTWRQPTVVNAFERNRARAFHIGYCLMVAYGELLAAMDRVGEGDADLRSDYTVRDGQGVGFWEGGRGALMHFATVEGGRLANYQILTPSTWMASPRDPWGVPGPYEEAIANTPILEESSPDDFVGVDILRAVRSFDPCLPCAVHVDAGAGVVIRDATTCACGSM